MVWFFRYMEQSHVMLEQRNDSLKSSSEQNQARLLQAEQDKVSALWSLLEHVRLLIVHIVTIIQW